MSEERLFEETLSARFLKITVPKKGSGTEPTYHLSDFSHLFSDQDFADHTNVLRVTYIETNNLSKQTCKELTTIFPATTAYASVIVVGECATSDFQKILNAELRQYLMRLEDEYITHCTFKISKTSFDNFKMRTTQAPPAPKKSKAFGILGNPSTWITGTFVAVGIAAAFIGLAPAAVVGWAALTLMVGAFAATVAALPLLIIFPAWLIWNDFKAQKIDAMLATHTLFEKESENMGQAYLDVSAAMVVRTHSAKTRYEYTARDYLSALPNRLREWVHSNKKQIMLVGLGITVSIVILLLLIAFPGVGPLAAASGFLGTLLSTGFSAIGLSVPALAGITAGLAQASSLIAMTLLTLAPLVIVDNARRIVNALPDKPVAGVGREYDALRAANDGGKSPTAIERDYVLANMITTPTKPKPKPKPLTMFARYFQKMGITPTPPGGPQGHEQTRDSEILDDRAPGTPTARIQHPDFNSVENAEATFGTKNGAPRSSAAVSSAAVHPPKKFSPLDYLNAKLRGVTLPSVFTQPEDSEEENIANDDDNTPSAPTLTKWNIDEDSDS